MNECAGCGYVFASSREVFGAVGQSFCFDCFCEDQELQARRELLTSEMDSLRRQSGKCEDEWNQARIDGDAATVLRMENIMSCAAMRMEDLQEELDCLTVGYQRCHSVIGRAA